MVVEIFEFELNCRVSFWCGASPQFSSTIALGKIGLTGNMSTSYSSMVIILYLRLVVHWGKGTFEELIGDG
jgi:hypothetical protein